MKILIDLITLAHLNTSRAVVPTQTQAIESVAIGKLIFYQSARWSVFYCKLHTPIMQSFNLVKSCAPMRFYTEFK